MCPLKAKVTLVALSLALSVASHAADPLPQTTDETIAAATEGTLWSHASASDLLVLAKPQAINSSAAVNPKSLASPLTQSDTPSSESSDPEENDEDEGEENTDRLIRHYQLEQLTSPDERRQMYLGVTNNRMAKDLPHGLSTPYQPWQPIGVGISRNVDRSYERAAAGRVSMAQYAFDQAQGATVLWAAGAGGGLWKGQLLGLFAVWNPVSRTMPDPTIGAFLVDRTNSDHLFIGTGNSWKWAGSGLYRSIDAGGTWTPVPLTPTPVAFYKILQDRANPNVMMAATNTGLYRSETAGASWTRIYTGDVTDLIQDPVTTSRWYAGLFTVGILESTTSAMEFHLINGDGGVSAGFARPFGRISLAQCESAPNYIYALTEANLKLHSVLRSDNFGASWVSIHGANGNKSQGANLSIAVQPSNPNRVVIGLTTAEMTTNATAAVPNWSAYDAGHADISSFLFVPDAVSPGNTNLIATNDGGIYITNYATGGVTDTLNTLGLNIEEMMAGSNLAGSRSDPNFLFTGLQDNGLVQLDNYGVRQHAHGDGGQVSISPDNANRIYATVGADWSRIYSPDRGINWQDLTCSFDAREWVPLLMIDPRPGLGAPNLFSASMQHNALVTGEEDLSVTPLSANETLTIMANGTTVVVNLMRGNNIDAVVSATQYAFTTYGLSDDFVQAFNNGNKLAIRFAHPGNGRTISVVSNRGLGAGTTGFGTTRISDTDSWSNVWYKPANTSGCDWAPVGIDAFNENPPFSANYVEKAMNPFYDVLYLSHWGDPRLFVYDSQYDGQLGAMTRHEVRTPPIAPRTSYIGDGRAMADRSSMQWDTVYYTTMISRPSQAFLSTNRGQSWEDVTGNMATLAPNADYFQLIGNPSNLNELFLATTVGVFYSHDRGRHWETFSQGLPAITRVSAMALQFDNTRDPKLYIGTQGQGFWSRSLSDTLFRNGFD